MDIVIPINYGYIKDRYQTTDDLLNFMQRFVVPELVGRLSRDKRVQSIDLISDIDLKGQAFGSEKVSSIFHVIDKSLNSDEVSAEILRVKHSKSQITVQYNPLFPFVSLESLWDAYSSVNAGSVRSAVGSYLDRDKVEDLPAAREHDLGVFSVYSKQSFNKESIRQALPTRVVGLKAVELIGLRNPDDYELFDLVVNSGFEL